MIFFIELRFHSKAPRCIGSILRFSSVTKPDFRRGTLSTPLVKSLFSLHLLNENKSFVPSEQELSFTGIVSGY